MSYNYKLSTNPHPGLGVLGSNKCPPYILGVGVGLKSPDFNINYFVFISELIHIVAFLGCAVAPLFSVFSTPLQCWLSLVGENCMKYPIVLYCFSTLCRTHLLFHSTMDYVEGPWGLVPSIGLFL